MNLKKQKNFKDNINNIKILFKNYLKNAKSRAEKKFFQSDAQKKKFKSAVLSAFVFAAVFCISSFIFTAGYEVYMNGEKIASVADEKDFEKILDEVNSNIKEITKNDYDCIFYTPSYSLSICKKSDISDDDEIRSRIALLSSSVRYATAVSVDGKTVFCAEDMPAIKTAVSEVIGSYSGDNATLLSDVGYKNLYVKKSALTEPQSVYLRLRSVLRVKTTRKVTYKEEIPFQTETTTDDEMYTGDEKIISPGINGAKAVCASVSYINGRETGRDIISQTVTQNPAVQTVAMGTKERPQGIGTGEMILPYDGKISSRFGERNGRRQAHKGVDLAGETGSPVCAADNGRVVRAEFKSDYGNIIVVDHQNGIFSYYAHLSKIYVSLGDIVSRGDIIGAVGSTGRSTGPHLHFEVRRGDTPIDPYTYIR